MKIGLGLFPTEPVERLRALTHQAEAEGYFQVWFGDSQCLWRELFLTAGASAVGTNRIRIGTGVTNLLTRHPSVIASAALTLNELLEGRTVLGVGAGDSAVRMVGFQPMRVADLERGIRDLRALLAGDEVTDPRTAARYHLGYGVPARVPIHVAASAPRLLRLAGRAADGVILGGGLTPELVRAGLDRIEEGAGEAGRSRRDLEIVLWAPMSISDDGTAARIAVRPYVARAVMGVLAGTPGQAFDAAVQRIRTSYDYYRHLDVQAKYGDLVPDQLVDQFAIAGSPDDCRRQLQMIAATEVDQLAVVPLCPPGQQAAMISEFIAVARASGMG